jgi:hypothetical protein
MGYEYYLGLQHNYIVYATRNACKVHPAYFSWGTPYRVTVSKSGNKTIIADNFDKIDLYAHHDLFFIEGMLK